MSNIKQVNPRTLVLVLIVFTSLYDVTVGHVSLRYPRARPLALDFLDNYRTESPCGEPRGNGPVTNIEAESNITVNWYLGYAHTGGYKIEILTYESNGQFTVAHTLTGSADQYVGGGNITTQQYDVILPKNFTCTNCTIRLIRQALNWGPSYLFWSCADVNIVRSVRTNCSDHGVKLANGTCMCDSKYYGDICQFEDECSNDSDCSEPNGECKFVSVNAVPRHQCFCRPGYFGLMCGKESILKSAAYNESLYVSRSLSSNLNVSYRILRELEEVEVVLRAKTTSYVGFGWKPTANACQGKGGSASEAEPEGTAKPEGGSKGSAQPEGSAEPEGVPEGTSKPEPEGSTKSEAIPEGSAVPEGKPEGTAIPEGKPPGDGTLNFPDGSTYAGQMDCTDIVIGKVVQGLHQVRDYYTRDRSTPRLDEFYGGNQSLTAAVAEEIDGVTTVIFRKPYKATDSRDHSIVNADMQVIWAHGQPPAQTIYGSFYAQDDLKYHGANRGSGSLNFFAMPEANNGETSQYKVGCTDNVCQYSASWSLDEATDTITFKIKAKQSADLWTGIGFGKSQQMMDMDVVLGFFATNGMGTIVDGWVAGQRTPPRADDTQNLKSSEIESINGTTILTFSRLRDTGDNKDWAFSDTECYYFMFPAGGGTVSNDWVNQHTNTPHVSSDKICIRSKTNSTASPSAKPTNAPTVTLAANSSASSSMSPSSESPSASANVSPSNGGPTFVDTANDGYQYPTGCGDRCLYSATWTLDEKSDIISFVLKANQSLDTWTAIAFGEEPKMEKLDVIYGFVATNSSGFVVDSWIGARRTPPVADAKQSLITSSAVYSSSGILIVKFSRLRDTGDQQDWPFTNDKCYYFIFPVGGGAVVDREIRQHTNIPSVSKEKICIKNSSKGSSARLIPAPLVIALIVCVTALRSLI